MDEMKNVLFFYLFSALSFCDILGMEIYCI